MLKGMRLNPPYNDLIPQTAFFYAAKIDVYKRLTDIVKALLAAGGGPKPGIDYGALAAVMPELRARLDSIDHTLFEASTLVCLSLLDVRADSKNHVTHLTISRDERDKLVETLTDYFGEKIKQKEKNYGVSSALILRSFLSDHKCSDDPWE